VQKEEIPSISGNTINFLFTGFLSSILSFPQIPICRPHFLLDKRENHDFFLFKKLIVLFTINITHINPTTPQMMVSFKSAKPPVYRIA
jgi:hypothetical protein